MYGKDREKDSLCPLVKEGTPASTSMVYICVHEAGWDCRNHSTYFNIVIYQGMGWYTYTDEGYMINVALSEENAPFKGTG